MLLCGMPLSEITLDTLETNLQFLSLEKGLWSEQVLDFLGLQEDLIRIMLRVRDSQQQDSSEYIRCLSSAGGFNIYDDHFFVNPSNVGVSRVPSLRFLSPVHSESHLKVISLRLNDEPRQSAT